MMLAVVRQRLRESARRPATSCSLHRRRGGRGHLGRPLPGREAPDLFEGVTEAVGEVGGFSMTLGQPAALPAADRGEGDGLAAADRARHGRARLDGAAGQRGDRTGRGDRPAGRHEWPIRLIPSVQAFLEGACEALGIEFVPNDPAQPLAKIGAVSRVIGATLRNTVNPTVFRAGYKVNVVPPTATAEIDGRFLPGYEEEFFAELDRVLGPGVTREIIHRTSPWKLPRTATFTTP